MDADAEAELDSLVMDPIALWVYRPDAASTTLCLDLAVVALALGQGVTVVLMQEAVAAWAEPELQAAPALAACREVGGARFRVLACSGAVERGRLDPDSLVDSGVFDDVLGLMSLWRRTAGAERLVI